MSFIANAMFVYELGDRFETLNPFNGVQYMHACFGGRHCSAALSGESLWDMSGQSTLRRGGKFLPQLIGSPKVKLPAISYPENFRQVRQALLIRCGRQGQTWPGLEAC